MFRVSDKYGKHAIKTKINACIMREKVSAEGDVLSNYFTPLKLEECGVFRWPTDVVHKITPDSPLWDISANDLMTSKYVKRAKIAPTDIFLKCSFDLLSHRK